VKYCYWQEFCCSGSKRFSVSVTVTWDCPGEEIAAEAQLQYGSERLKCSSMYSEMAAADELLDISLTIWSFSYRLAEVRNW